MHHQGEDLGRKDTHKLSRAKADYDKFTDLARCGYRVSTDMKVSRRHIICGQTIPINECRHSIDGETQTE